MNLLYRFISTSLLFISFWGKAQTVSLTVNKSSMSENQSAIITASLSSATSEETIIKFTPSGTAKLQGDYSVSDVGKGTVTTVAGGNGSGNADNQLNSPYGVAVDASGNVFIPDHGNQRIQKWIPGSAEGVTVAGGSGGSGSNQLSSPYGVAVDASENLYIADTYNHRIQKWAPGATEGVTVAGGNGDGPAANQFNWAIGVAVDALGNIYVCDYYNHRIQKWAPGATEGVTVAGGNGAGFNSNQLNYPSGVAIDGVGNIYVADMNNERVQKWLIGATEGVTVAGGNGQGAALNQLSRPTGVSVDASGNLYIADRNNSRIQKWGQGATTGTTVAGGGNQLNLPFGIALDASGNLYIADSRNNRIQKVTMEPQIIIAAGETSGTLIISAIDDNLLLEGTETVILTPTATGATLISSDAITLTIDDSVPTVTGVTSTTANGSYKQGDVIAITVEFSEVVNVTGTPQLTLETGDNDAVVNYSSGTGSNTLTFNYTIGSGETSDDLDYVSTNSLAISVTIVDADGDGFPDLDGNGDLILNIGTIKDAGLNDAILTLASPGAINSLGGNKDLKINEANQSIPNHVPSEGLISWYPFNGNANDESGSGNNGTLSGATLDLDRFGNLNSSFSFNGSTDYIAFNLGSIENKLPANSASTSSVWIKTEDLQGPIISLQGTGGYTYNLHIGTLSNVVKSSGDYGMMIRDNCCGIGNYKWGSNVVNNNWHMITIVRSSNGTLKLYKDGVLDATGNSGSSGELIFTPTKMAFGADLDWIILSKEGCGSCNTVDDQYFEGLLDDVGIWNRALTETEIIELYSGGDTPPKSGLDPTLTITARNDSGVVLDSTISNDSQVVLTFTTSQATTNFTVDDILVTNGTLSNFTAISSTIYTTNLTPLNDGSITVNVPMNVFTDAAGNSNTTSDQFNWIYDGTPPNMTISVTNGINSLSDGAVTADTSLIVTFTTNEPIINLYLEDIIVEGGGFLSFTKTSASVYTGTFAPYVVSDTILIKVLSSVFTDLVGNTNTSISQFNWIYDPNEEPIILSFNTTFPENIANGSIIGIIEAIDPDDDILSFNIISGNEKGAFKLDSVSGQLAVLDNVPLDFEINPSFELMISVSDGFHIIYATINISLSDVLENEDDETALSIMKDASKMIYPNPAMDIINIEMTEFKEATIYNLSGRKVLRSNDSRINVNSLIKGVYIMELENKSGERFSTKLIKD